MPINLKETFYCVAKLDSNYLSKKIEFAYKE
jgi:hypothetical protein